MDLLLTLPTPEATDRLAQTVAAHVGPGDTLALNGQIGAGKTHFARALIQTFMAEGGVVEDVPSPTFTLVQTYHTPRAEIWHADLYRLASVGEVDELGLFDAMDHALVLIEWAERLGPTLSDNVLSMTFAQAEPGRTVRLFAQADRWQQRLGDTVDA